MYTNTPLALIPTPKFQTGRVRNVADRYRPNRFSCHQLLAMLCCSHGPLGLQDDPFTIEASHMALSHNAFIRGFNTIYQQAPRLRNRADKTDFVGYCLAWIDCVATHHHYEETELFPNINKAAGQTALMEDAVHEHEAFMGGMERLKTYLLETGADFSSTELIATPQAPDIRAGRHRSTSEIQHPGQADRHSRNC
jgi:hypothetical protein